MIKPSLSFKYNGVPFTELDKQVQETESSIIYTLPDGLKLECRIEKYSKYNVIKWTNYWRNDTDHDCGIISELWDCDTESIFDLDPVKTRRNKRNVWETDMLKVYVTKGANVQDDDNFARFERLWEGEQQNYKCKEGRSCLGTAPFFDINRLEKGVIMAVGWTGGWASHFERHGDKVRMCCGVEGVEFYMRPGECFRTASVTFLEYSNGQDNAHNLWRRYIKDIVSPVSKQERDKLCPFSAIFWGGVSSNALMRRWSKIKEAKLPLDYCWIDAGWYEPLTGETTSEQSAEWPQVGTWTVNRKYHPNGYRDVIDFLTEKGVKMLVWFEPERMWRAIGMWNKWLDNGNPNVSSSIVALNDNEATDKLIELISLKIKELSLSWYRQDYNILPASYWAYTDEQDGEFRTGVTQIKYINNLYRFWDTILQRYPHLLIDNCAGGGHRIDIETLGRSVPLWRSDYQCFWDNCPEANQIQNSGAAWWYPYSGIGFGPTLGDTYSFRSAYTAGLTIRTWEHVDPEWEVGAMNEPLDWAKKYFDEYDSIRDYFSCDFYPLIKNACDNVSWSASQFDKPEDQSGIILAFRRAMCPNPIAEVALGGVDESKTYEFTDVDTGLTTAISGDELKKNGMTLTIQSKRQSLLIKYIYR